MLVVRFRLLLLCLIASLSSAGRVSAAEYRPLPLAPRGGLSADWLIYDAARNSLILYLPDYHTPAQAYYQWISVRPDRPLPITFTARKDLSLFLDNRLVFSAGSPASYTLDLASLLPKAERFGTHLLCVWQPEVPPNLASFTNAAAAPAIRPGKADSAPLLAQPRPRGHQGQNVFLCFLLLIGLLYGGIRATYQPGFARIYQFEGLWSKQANDQDFLTKPTLTWLNLLLVLVFALSFALLLVAIHTNIQTIVILRRLFDVPESAIVLRVLLYAALVAGFVLGKYLFLELMGYIFDVTPLVMVQYREFVRTILFMGLFLPLVMLLYLGLNQTLPEAVLWISNGVVSLMLIGTVVRIARTLHRRASLLNLHLFSYLCATEVIPLIILLKLVVFTY
ncbi:protein of unknown function [Hymenobacter daecheongensis DSM 21074]|uniref:DUF4271 domain-containing protein n=1 Tax=Hymenobacter daecheongensis DSM 21074 TaxID=1121955 RepID=A0A1M6ACD0_9BACT|nr:DUF4271 domain-containing protein [Hymenobacter daecheongensis]SHI34071.1 protein of unknown function [Hymenobacter daecheongensis DSM 21074]